MFLMFKNLFHVIICKTSRVKKHSHICSISCHVKYDTKNLRHCILNKQLIVVKTINKYQKKNFPIMKI